VGETSLEFGGAQVAKTTLVCLDDKLRRGGKSRILLRRRLSCVWSESGDKNERRHVRMHAGFGDYRSAPRMANEHRGASLAIERAPGRRDIVSKRGERGLPDAPWVPPAVPPVSPAAPAGTVGERAV